MLTTDGQGHDLDLTKTPDVRYYVLASFQHGTGSGISEGICRQLQNPLNFDWVQKALLVDLDQWVSNGTAPPANEVPTIKDGTLVPALPQSGMGFPSIPNLVWGTSSNVTGVFSYSAGGPTPNLTLPQTAYVFYNGIHHTGDLWDFRARLLQRYLTSCSEDTADANLAGSIPWEDAMASLKKASGKIKDRPTRSCSGRSAG